MARSGPGKWSPAEATKRINRCASDDRLDLALALHVEDRLEERDLLMGDLLHLLEFGFVYDEPQPATREGFFKYQIEGTTPNSNGRTVAAIVIPDDSNCMAIKVVTVMWRDGK